ncbi:MopE-related protein [Thermodesulfobacteriota bacterium]
MKNRLNYLILALLLVLSIAIIACDSSSDPTDDLDGDGFTIEEGDCNDLDDSINPDAAEICGDGIDQNCDGTVDNPCTPVYLLNKVGSYATIQLGIAAAVDGDTVVVRDGTYYENIDFIGKKITVKSEHGAALTSINGGNTGLVVTFEAGEDATSILDGFTITNGTSTGWGAGIYIKNAAPTIKDCTITANNTKIGGGLYIISSADIGTVTITGSTISANTATNKGGGMYCYTATVAFTNCTISTNSATNNGGGLYVDNSTVTVTDCTITGNSAGAPNGGGIYCSHSTVTVTGGSVTSNTPDDTFCP